MNGLSLSSLCIRIIIFILLLLIPLTSAWNLVVAPRYPALAIKIGPKLNGVTYDKELDISLRALLDGSLQKAVASRVGDALALRPMLIRMNNEIRFSVFGEMTAPQVVRGAKGQLIERSYLLEYCGRTDSQAATLAAEMIPKLQVIRDYYHARGAIFLYLISPSKAAHMPEYFVNAFPCPSTISARTSFLPHYVDLLRMAEIEVVDTASLIHSLRREYEVDLFPQGGVHWNDLGGARAMVALIDNINSQSGNDKLPRLQFTYTLTSATGGVDRELADLLNLFFPPLAYQTPKLKYQTDQPCADAPAKKLDIAIVGSSFSHLPGKILTEHDCLERLNVYYYMRLGRFGGNPYHEVQRNLRDIDLIHLRDARIVIVEENESFVARSTYVSELLKIVSDR